MTARAASACRPCRACAIAPALLLLLGACVTPALAVASPLTVVFGAVGGTSGARGPVGQDHNNGVILAVEELNRSGLRIGGQPVVWKVEAEDDQGDPKQAATVAYKLIDSKVNAVIGHDTSGASYAAERLYAAAGIPMLAAAATDARLARLGSPTFFRVISDDSAAAAALVRYAARELHARRVATIDDRTAFGQGLADAFARGARERGMEVVAREYTHEKAFDFAAVLTRLRGMQPDLILFGGVFGQAAPLLRQFDQLQLRGVVLAGDGACVPQLPRLAAHAVERIVCADGGQALLSTPRGVAWKQRYDRRFGADAFQAYSPYAYDATMLVAQAMVRAGSADPARYLSFLRNTDYDGVTRKHIRFLPNGNLAEPQIAISVYRHGRKVPAQAGSGGCTGSDCGPGAPRQGAAVQPSPAFEGAG